MLMYTPQMSSLIFTMIFKFLTISLCFYQCASSLTYGNVPKTTISTIIVDQSGKGNFTKVQDAIDSIPENNSRWVRVRVRAGIFNEKVTIPRNKPFIVLEGDGRSTSVIQAAEGGSTFKSSTFTLKADNFVARNIAFKNNHDKNRSRGHTWAPAAVIASDKAAFYKCDFISVQDTLTDSEGRHYFESCYIQGVFDFIWGGGQSIYKGCTINVSYEFGTRDGRGYITAQARRNAHSPNGFVFKNCTIIGTTSAYLGRAYTPYSRVLFYQSHFERTVVPEGWYAWNCAGREKDIIFAEKGCEGPGAHTNHRVKWEKNLSSNEVKALVDVNTFINQDGWMYKLPRPQQI